MPSNSMPMPGIDEPKKRIYTNLKGVDFSSISSRVDTSRSPDAKNVYKDYFSQLGQAIETRPGINLLGDLSNLFDKVNLLSNWNFDNGTDNWNNVGLSSFTVTDGIATLLANSTNDDIYQGIADAPSMADHVVYAFAYWKSTSSIAQIETYDGITWIAEQHSGSGSYEFTSFLRTLPSSLSYLNFYVRDKRSSGYDNIYVDYVGLIDLTELFGAGNEPDKATMDTIISSYITCVEWKINGIHILDNKTLIHIGNRLLQWDTFPSSISSIDDITDMIVTMNNAASKSFLFYDKLYILDGINYLEYDGTSVQAVVGTVPTTRVASDPNGANYENYQNINYLSDYRINSFVGDNTSSDYYLDAQEIDSVEYVIVNGVTKTPTTHYSVNTTTGVVTMVSTSNAPLTPGQDNVFIKYKKAVSGYPDHIKKCTICKIFDNRVFVSGNDSHKGYVFNSGLEDPAYFPDMNKNNDGGNNLSVKAIIASSEKLIVVKEDKDSGIKVFLHTAALDSTDGKIYPMTETEISLGALSEGINFRDSALFISKQGLENIYLSSPAKLYHRSSRIDTKFINELSFEDAKMEIWTNYLCVLVNGKIYLADSNQMSNYEYEWYYWDNIGVMVDGTLDKAIILKEYDDNLYFGTDSGRICVFAGTHDDSLVAGVNTPTLIDSYWTTPMDVFTSLTHLKTTNKRGGVVQIKRIPNSIFKIDIKTDKEDYINILEKTTSGFSFEDFLAFLREEEGYDSFSFGTGSNGFLVFKVKKRKIKQFSMKFYSGEIDKPFGIYEATIEYYIGNYIKN